VAVRDGFAVCATARKRGTEMTDGTTSTAAGNATTGGSAVALGEGAAAQDPQQQEPKTFTQAELDAIVRDRLKQQAKNQFGDYDELKAKAAGAQTLEERLGTLEAELSSTKIAALRTSIAAKFGVSTEKAPDGTPSDAELFLTGTDESTLTTQAQRLAGRQADSKKHGNVAPREGQTTLNVDPKASEREFVRDLFGRVD
jgi:hypothetical protein